MIQKSIPRYEIQKYREILMEAHDDSKNTHKYYHFIIPDENASRFQVKYGRVGKSPNSLDYPISDLYKKYNEKINKGYKTLKTSMWNEDSLSFKTFLDEFLSGGDDCWLPD